MEPIRSCSKLDLYYIQTLSHLGGITIILLDYIAFYDSRYLASLNTLSQLTARILFTIHCIIFKM